MAPNVMRIAVTDTSAAEYVARFARVGRQRTSFLYSLILLGSNQEKNYATTKEDFIQDVREEKQDASIRHCSLCSALDQNEGLCV